jgi:transketolase
MGYMGLPIVLVGAGGGLTYSYDGPTHHATNDIAILRTVSGLTMYTPSDPVSTKGVAKLCLKDRCPTYVRLEKGEYPDLYLPGHDFTDGFHVLRQRDSDVTLIGVGMITHTVLEAAVILDTMGLEVNVIDLYRVKPMPVLPRSKLTIVVEESSPYGGIDARNHISLPDRPCYQYGSRPWLHEMLGISAKSIAYKVLAMYHSSCCFKLGGSA